PPLATPLSTLSLHDALPILAWIEHPDYDPFWAITKHADVIELSKQPGLFQNAPRLAVFSNKLPPPPEAEVRHLLNMDPPDHGRYRNVTSKQFTPRVVQGLHEKVERITREVLDEAAARGEGDFVRDVSRSEEHTSELQSRENSVCR